MEVLSRPTSHLSSLICLFLCLLISSFAIYLSVPPVSAGPFEYGNESGYERYDRVHMNNPCLIGWATGFENFEKGSHLDQVFETPEKALGEAG